MLNEGQIKINELLCLVQQLPQTKTKSIPAERRNNIPFSMVMKWWNSCKSVFIKHLRMGTARMKEHENRDEEKQERVKMGISKVGKKIKH